VTPGGMLRLPEALLAIQFPVGVLISGCGRLSERRVLWAVVGLALLQRRWPPQDGRRAVTMAG
jgi:hypothetical protein